MLRLVKVPMNLILGPVEQDPSILPLEDGPISVDSEYVFYGCSVLNLTQLGIEHHDKSGNLGKLPRTILIYKFVISEYQKFKKLFIFVKK